MSYQQTLFVPSQFALFTFPNVGTNFTTNNINGIQVGWGNLSNTNTPANGDYINWAVPGTISTGLYSVEYLLLQNTDIAIIDFSYKANGAGGYTNLRAGIDCYYNQGAPISFIFKDYFVISTAGSLNLRWTVNGKNGSSSAFIVFLGVSSGISMSGIKITRIA